MCKMMIIGKRKDRATKASALMDSIRQSVGSVGSSSHLILMSAGTVPPRAPPLIVLPPPVDSSSTGSPSSTPAPDSARHIIGSARLKVRSLTGLSNEPNGSSFYGRRKELWRETTTTVGPFSCVFSLTAALKRLPPVQEEGWVDSRPFGTSAAD
ncbi:hypothetical protein ACLB2K_016444 [Fragaria x ananassa]